MFASENSDLRLYQIFFIILQSMLNVKLKSSLSFNQTNSFTAHRNSMANRHHIDSHTGIQSIHLSYPRHFVSRQTYPYRKQWVLSVRQKSNIQDRCLQKRRQASGYDLLAPAVKAVGVAPRNPEHIQAPDSYLAKHYAASLDVCKHNFYRAVAEQNYENRLNSDTSEARATMTESPVPATVDEVAPMKPPNSS